VRLSLDSSALVKLVQMENESRALLARLSTSPDHFVTSTLAKIEVTRAVFEGGPEALELVRRHFLRIDQIVIDAAIVESASTVAPGRKMRTLDALHLATALLVGDELRSVITYDVRMADAARGLGLAVESPS
jgi:predicted nucleic acid-binding protein